MTQEEKAKAYDEALERAKSVIEQNPLMEYLKKGIEYILPELVESEDERIRKSITEFFKNYSKNGTWKAIPDVTKWIAWLEKQCEQKPQGKSALEAAKEEKVDNQNCVKPVDKVEPKFKVGDKIYLKPEYRMPNDDTPIANTVFEIRAIDDKHYRFDGSYIFIEDQDKYELVEQNPTDKVEPKFHEGEWLCENELNNYARFVQILEIVNVQGKDRYRISRDIHKDEDIVEFDFVEKYYHKFDIQDAKDGDVLHCWIDGYEFVLIYKGIKDGYITTYGHLYQNLESFSEEPTTMFCRTIQGHFTPATKEQRDILFAKMKEAGYKWDAEKKELNKIVQKPIDEPKFKVKYANSEYNVLETKEIAGVTYYGIEDEPNHIDYVLPDNCKIVSEHNPAWSEEDAQYLLVCKNALAKYQVSDKWDATIISRWLENKLKASQNRWKPSEEQMKSLRWVIEYGNTTQTETLKGIYEQLKKLREE